MCEPLTQKIPVMMTEPTCRHFVLVLGLLLMGPASFGGATEWSGSSPDTSEVTVRTPDPETLASFREDPDYVYERDSGFSWWDRVKAWLLDRLEASWNVPGVPILARILAVLAVAGMFLLAVRWLQRTRSSRPIEGGEELSQETMVSRAALEHEDFASKAQQAAADGAYRQAVRFQYLWLLQRLVHTDYIRWTPEKTNYELVAQTQGTDVHDDFRRATELFDAVWYGGVSLDQPAFEQVRSVIERAREPVSLEPVSTVSS